jgi:NadR type nicotinamide-nucleotide adenylyltransferase
MTLGKDPAIMEGIESEFVGHGLVFGKFMPPTNGHLHFIEFARRSCRKLTIVVCSLPGEPIPGETRFKWMKELFPDCNVVHHYAEIQQEPKTSPQDPTGAGDVKFFETWRDSLRRHCPGEKFDALFASEDYGFRMADIMGIKFIPVDIKRELVPISGTEMRKNPLKHWNHLHPVIRPYFAKRIAVVGADGDRKAALAGSLAAHFNTVHAGEYARSYLQECEKQMPGYAAKHMTIRDFSTIARGQVANEESLARQANCLLFCDTELTGVARQAKAAFGQCPAWIEKLAAEKTYDLYLLPEPLPGENRAEFDWWKAELGRRKAAYETVSGADDAKRLANAVGAVCRRLPQMAFPNP